MKKAIITTDEKVFQLYLFQNSLNFKDARMIARKSDLDGTVFDEVIDLDPRENVTAWVRDRINRREQN